MRNRLQRILSLLCVLALAVVCVTAGALADLDPAVQYETRILIVEWMDADNYDGLRENITATLGGETAELKESNGWTGAVVVPEGTGNDWAYTVPAGYTQSGKRTGDDGITRVTFNHAGPQWKDIPAEVTWEDGKNAGGIRPDSVQLMLKADGKACGVLKAEAREGWKVTWKNMPSREPKAENNIVYTVEALQVPTGYSGSASGLGVTFTLETAKLGLSVDVSGYPEDADLSSLAVTVFGPDPKMPVTLKYGELAGGTYDFGDVVAGAYLVCESTGSHADTLIEGYTMDTANSHVADAVYVAAGESKTLTFKYAWKLPEAYDAPEDPWEKTGSLEFRILGPDPRTPITLTYSQFTDGKYKLENLVPGTYVIVELNAETLVDYFTLTSESIAGVAITVGTDGKTATATLFNQYTPAPTPEPDADTVDIPVTKTWNDNNNKDGNRPESITVVLYADGVAVDSVKLPTETGWSYTFTEKPRYREGTKEEIVYSVNENAVEMYTTVIKGWNIINEYNPEETSASVKKIWKDNNNKTKNRPPEIAVKLSNGSKVVAIVILNEDNNWSATVNHLPVKVNGKTAEYKWSEQKVIGYDQDASTQKTDTGIQTTFTNTLWTRPNTPTKGRAPKTPGDTWYVFDDYDTPLGVEIIINHVGDCFD